MEHKKINKNKLFIDHLFVLQLPKFYFELMTEHRDSVGNGDDGDGELVRVDK